MLLKLTLDICGQKGLNVELSDDCKKNFSKILVEIFELFNYLIGDVDFWRGGDGCLEGWSWFLGEFRG